MNNFNQFNIVDKKKAKEINLKELFQVIKRRFWIIALITAFASIVGGILSNSSITPLYQSSSRIIITGSSEEDRKTLQVIVKDSTILDKVIEELNLGTSAEALAGQITVASIESSQVVSISVIDKDPKLAAIIADTTAQVFKDEVPKIVLVDESNDYVRILSAAKVNPVPINGNNNNKLFMAIIGGMVIGFGLAFLLESLDDTIRSEREIETLLGVPVLGKVSKMNKRNVKKKNHSKYDLELGGETIGIK